MSVLQPASLHNAGDMYKCGRLPSSSTHTMIDRCYSGAAAIEGQLTKIRIVAIHPYDELEQRNCYQEPKPVVLE